MEQSPLDYDTTNIAAVYDRARDHGPAVRNLWMRAVEAETRGRGEIDSILDLGCGTGRFSRALSDHFGARVLAIDPSTTMLAEARSKQDTPQVRHALARGEEVPLDDGSIDLIFMSMVFHHFSNPAQVAGECRRVLRPKGIAFMRAGVTDRIDSYPYVPFFPASIPLLYRILPSCAYIREVFEKAGFRCVTQEILVQEIAATHGEYCDKLEAGGDSVLARLSEDEFLTGIAKLRALCADVDPEPVVEPIDYFAFGGRP